MREAARCRFFAQAKGGWSMEDCFPHYDFDFNKIREYWKLTLGNYAAAKKYLQVIQRRLEYWTKEQGPWIDFDFAAKHLVDDLHVFDAESRLMWLASQTVRGRAEDGRS
jgi:hypothetical protein